MLMFSTLNKLYTNYQIVPHLINKILTLKSLSTIAKNSQKMATDNNIAWMDLEMTGLDVIEDKILEVSMLITDKDLNIIADGPCIAINHPSDVFERMNDWCQKHHRESGLVEKCLRSQTTTQQAEQLLLDFLKKHVPKGKCPLAGNSVYMDRLFLRQHMPRVDDYLHYRIIDVSTIKELSRRWYPKVFEGVPEKKLVHRSLDDIKESIEELKYYRQAVFKVE